MKKNMKLQMKKKENLDSKLQILTPNQEIFKNEEIFIFLSFFFHFPCPWHLKSRKAMKNNEKPSKTKENEKKNEVANEKKWKFGLKIADSHSEPGNLQKLEEIFIFFSFFILFHFFFIFLAPGT